MVKKSVLMFLAMLICMCTYSSSALSATGYYKQEIFGKVTVICKNPIRGSTKDSSQLSVTIRDQNIPSDAKIEYVVVKFGSVTDEQGGPISSIQTILIDPRGNPKRKTFGSNKQTTFIKSDFLGEPLSPLGKWTVAYVGQCFGICGLSTKSYKNITLEFAYTY